MITFLRFISLYEQQIRYLFDLEIGLAHLSHDQIRILVLLLFINIILRIIVIHKLVILLMLPDKVKEVHEICCVNIRIIDATHHSESGDQRCR
jgi:hypothetical protein